MKFSAQKRLITLLLVLVMALTLLPGPAFADETDNPAETSAETLTATVSVVPSESVSPSAEVTESLSTDPSASPSTEATVSPSAEPSADPSAEVTVSPSTDPSAAPKKLARRAAPTDFKTYLAAEYTYSSGTKAEHRGTITLTLLDADKNVVQKNTDGNYVVETGKDYQVQFAVNAISVDPGTYTYQLPTGIKYTATNGTITTSDGTKIGNWSIDANGLVTFVFNDNSQSAQNISFTYTVTVAFETADVSIPFDGSVSIKVKKPPEEETTQTYNVSKYKNSIDGNTIQWQASVVGDGEHPIAGSTVTDTLSGTNQALREQDITLVIWENKYYSDKDNKKYRHEFTISQNDQNLKWTRDASGNITGWTYTIPETVTGCRQAHDDGYKHTDDNKTYTVKDTDTIYFRYSTEIVNGSAGPYTNSFTHGEKTASYTTDTPRLGVIKTGGLDADAGVYKWHLELSVPKVSSGALLNVSLRERMNVLDTSGKAVAYLNMNLDSMKSATVTATVTKADGSTETVQVPKYTGNESSDVQYVYKTASWTSSSGEVYYYVDFYKRCTCSADHCAKWDSEKNKCTLSRLGDFCRCFNGNAVTFKVDMEQDAAEALTYQGLGYKIDNFAWAQRYVVQPSGSPTNVTDDKAEVKENIPGVFDKKQLAEPGADNGWIASFEITVNESLADLSAMTAGVTVADKMSDTLVFLPGSLKITTTDQNGGTGTLTKDTDYTVSYDSGTHTVTIKLLHPGKYQYTLDYAAAITAAEGGTTSTYSNSATVTLLGHTYSDSIAEKGISGWSATGEEYSVTIHKTAADTEKALSGAQFGLFSSDGTRIALGTTDENGDLTFKTDSIAGLIFYTDTAYYIQEIQAPLGYVTDSTMHWFFFDGAGTAPTQDGATITKFAGTSGSFDVSNAPETVTPSPTPTVTPTPTPTATVTPTPTSTATATPTPTATVPINVAVTGDDANLTLWAMLAALSLLGLAAAVVITNRKKYAGTHGGK